jgi:hypothetical protein
MIPAEAPVAPDAASVLAAGPDAAALEARLAEGADEVAGARRSIQGHPQLLVAAAATLMVAGVVAVLLGWAGASQSTYVEEQVPYLISGGLLGVALATIGALLYFTHWLTVSIKEARAREVTRRADHAELMEALRALAAPTPPTPGGNDRGTARGPQPGRPVRRAPRGS